MVHNYFVYIVTNKNRTVLYIGITNDLYVRVNEHYEDAMRAKKHFAGKYNAFYLIYWERFDDVNFAIEREKALKGWRRSKKEALINAMNPSWDFLNDTL